MDNSLTQEDLLTITDNSTKFLIEISKWTKFLSILGFVIIGIMVIGGLFAGTILSNIGTELPFPGFIIGLFYIFIALIYLFPVLYIYRFSTKLKIALSSMDSITLEAAFQNLKSHYKFIGIFTIVALGLYLVLGIGSFLIAAILQ
ncbi:MAG: hypothetical protein DRI71_11385 [Bacteroidetes bacterium]|nr:MAG: hypothetical protein DRI71_11385 [Bacteroidota bacterium]